MEDSKRALLALGVVRLLNLQQKKLQIERAKKVMSYLKLTRALKSDLFKHQLRIDSSSLFKLLGLLRPYIEVLNDDIEEVTVEERLLVTLQYLATGNTMNQLSNESKIQPELLAEIIPDTCRGIYKCLQEYIMFPKTEKDWENIASSFERKYQFPHCVGALVAKHIAIEPPSYQPEKFVNHKKFHSIILTAVINADYEFTYFNVGCDGGYEYVYVSTELFEKLIEDSLHLPSDCPLKGTDYSMPYIFLGETDFLIENIMKPYPPNDMTEERRLFNYRFARAKRVADNAFGILFERFGLFQQNISIADEHLNSVVMACCALHNFLIKSSKEYLNEDSLDVEDVNNFMFKPASWRLIKDDVMESIDTHPLLSIIQKEETQADGKGVMVRHRFTKYFNNEGKVPFQDQMVNVVPDV